MTGQNCENCSYYVEYYTKGYCRFNRTRRGYCNKNKHPTNNKEACEKWKDNRKSSELRKELSLNVLNVAVESIFEVKQILKEELTE